LNFAFGIFEGGNQQVGVIIKEGLERGKEAEAWETGDFFKLLLNGVFKNSSVFLFPCLCVVTNPSLFPSICLASIKLML
jgi:hypothetical protein